MQRKEGYRGTGMAWWCGKRVLQFIQFGYICLAAPLLDLVGISTDFCGTISTQFCFSYSLGSVTAMPRGLHARLWNAFLVSTVLHSELSHVKVQINLLMTDCTTDLITPHQGPLTSHIKANYCLSCLCTVCRQRISNHTSSRSGKYCPWTVKSTDNTIPSVNCIAPLYNLSRSANKAMRKTLWTKMILSAI